MAKGSPSVSQHVPNVGLALIVKELTKLLDKSEKRFGPEPPAITTEEKRRGAKVRKGAAKVIQNVAAMVQQHKLDSEALHSEVMLARLADVETLTPLLNRVEKLSKRVSDELYGAGSEAWDMALQFYALLSRRAQHDGELQKTLAPVAEFFAYRHPSRKEGKPTKRQVQAEAKLRKAVKTAKSQKVAVEPVVATAPPPPAHPATITVSATASTVPPAVVPASPAPAPTPTHAASAPSAPTSGIADAVANGAGTPGHAPSNG